MPKPVIHDHDGHVDDLLSCLLLWLAPQVDLMGVGVTNGDCYADQAFEAMLKMATFLDLEGAEVGIVEDEVPNRFPENWRKESYIINELPLFGENALKKTYQQSKRRLSDEIFYDCLAHSKQPVTVVTTGPLTNLARLFKNHPELKDNVEEFVTMGGAMNVKGNVEEEGHDGSAEWNIYADPQAFKSILETGLPMRLISLDVTNEVPMTKEFLDRLDKQSDSHRASLLAVKLWSLVKGFSYYFWDTVTAAAAIDPGLFTFKEMKIDVAVSGKSMGKTASSLFSGRKIRVATALDKPKFEDLLLTILRSK